MSQVISTRVPSNIVEDIEFIAKVEKLDKSSVIRKLLIEAINEWKKKYALKLYKDGKITLWKAAKIAGLSLWEFMELLASEGINLNYTVDELMEDFKAVLNEKNRE